MYEYEYWETKDKTTLYKEFADIQRRPPIVLSCEEENGSLLIYAACGQIKTGYDKASLFLANGDELSFEKLDSEATGYWDEWSRQTNT